MQKIAKAAGSARSVYIVPLLVFIVVVALCLFGLGFFSSTPGGRNPNELPSVLIGKPVPTFSLEPLEGLTVGGKPIPGLNSEELKGDGVTVINIWASWCVPCRQEHPILMKMAEMNGFRLVGINYKDDPGNARAFLGGLGNPFSAVGTDIKGRTGIDFGVYGVPETFIIGPDATIRHKHIGPLLPGNIESFLKKIEEAKR